MLDNTSEVTAYDERFVVTPNLNNRHIRLIYLSDAGEVYTGMMVVVAVVMTFVPLGSCDAIQLRIG